MIQAGPGDPARRGAVPLAVAFLAGVLVALHHRSFGIPFLSDDYAFLDQSRAGLIPSLVHAFTEVPNYFRPLGREIWFWALGAVSGDNALVLHLANFAVLVATLALVALVGTRLLGLRAGLLAAGAYALLYPHRVQLGFISCSQDLIATALATGAVLLHVRDRRPLAAATYFMALLAKESVVILPLVLLIWEAWNARGRGRLRHGFEHTLPLWVATAAWVVMVVGPRLSFASLRTHAGGVPIVDVALDPRAFTLGFWLALLTYVGLEQPWQALVPALRASLDVWPALLLAAAFPVLVWRFVPARPVPRPAPRGARTAERRELLRLGLVWATIGALPVAIVAQRFNAYYVSFAAVGFAFVVGSLLERVPAGFAVAGFVAAAGLCGAANATAVFRVNESDRSVPPGVSISSFARLESDARYVTAFHDFLRRNPPPRGATIYFSQGFGYSLMGTGGEHAPRVWFHDPGLRTRVMRSYVPGADPGPKMFVRFDDNPPRFVLLPDSLATAIVEGEEALREDHAAQARVSLERALALSTPGVHDPIRVELRNALGVAEDKLGDTGAARASWLAVLELDPNNRGALINLAAIAMDRGRPDEAQPFIERVLATNPDDALALDYARRIEAALTPR